MAAAAGAAGLSAALVGEPHDWSSGLLVWAGSIAGGVLEGLAVGLLQFAVLTGWLPGLSRRRWLGATVGVALVGWAAGMAVPSFVVWQGEPSTGSSGAGGGPPLWLMPFAGAVAGAVAGVVFGAAQAWALRGQVLRPRRWVLANVLGWAAAMGIIMTGASIPNSPWPAGQLLALGGATGILAGLAIGAITGGFLPSLIAVRPDAVSSPPGPVRSGRRH
jgi:hypothetical protein